MALPGLEMDDIQSVAFKAGYFFGNFYLRIYEDYKTNLQKFVSLNCQKNSVW